jgi:RNA polymerase sigma-70 factor, ECF subfamily
MRIVRDQQLAEELLQESLWLVWQRAEQYGGAGSVAAWLHRIARNRALDQLRHLQARPQRRPEEISVLDASPALQQPSAAHEAETAWRQQQLYLALSSLPVEQQQCLELAYFDGMSQREIAEQTNTPLGTIKTRVRMGMEKVERLLRAAGLTAERM